MFKNCCFSFRSYTRQNLNTTARHRISYVFLAYSFRILVPALHSVSAAYALPSVHKDYTNNTDWLYWLYWLFVWLFGCLVVWLFGCLAELFCCCSLSVLTQGTPFVEPHEFQELHKPQQLQELHEPQELQELHESQKMHYPE